ncbi:hypothetical protein ACU4GD_24255 [Cupriavidus basilensis]
MEAACRSRLETVIAELGVAVAGLDWQCDAAPPPADFTAKRRRIVRLRSVTHDA